MTVYNAGIYLSKSIDSLLAQSYLDWELIVVDDGSSDESLQILKKYSDIRINIFSFEENKGRTFALRFAFDKAHGEYIAVLDADDISTEDRLSKQIKILDFNPDVGLVASWAQLIDEDGNIFDYYQPPISQDELMNSLGWTNPIIHSSVMYRKKLAQEVGGYPLEFVWAQDFGLFLSLACITKFLIIDEFLCQLRVLSSSMTRSKKNQILVASESLRLFIIAKNTLKLSHDAIVLNRRSLAVSKIKLGISMLRNNSIMKGLNFICSGVISSPSALWGNGIVRRYFGCKF